MISKAKTGLFVICFLGLISYSCCLDCSTPGSDLLFTAVFDYDVPGNPPSLTTIYGPPGASLIVFGNAIIISGEDPNKLLKLTRSNSETKITGRFGDTENVNACDLFSVNMTVKGEVIPLYYISSAIFSLTSINGATAFSLWLYNEKYHYYDTESNAIMEIAGDYDASQLHFLKILVDPVSRSYTVCVNNENLLCGAPFTNSAFDYRGAFNIALPATVLEGFENILLVDDLRVIQ